VDKDAYDIDIVVQGFPGKSVCHGGLGWSSVVLLRGHGRVALVDTGSFGMRRLLAERLKARGLKPGDVTDVLLTHSHHDHSVNWTMFRHARIVIGATELDWSLKQPWGETPVPELYMRELSRWPSVVRAKDGEEVMPSVRAHVAAGHTPGCMVYVAHDRSRDIIFTGDAAKNRAELMSRSADMTESKAQTRASMEMIWEFWRRRKGNVLVPGHDLPMTQVNGRTSYIGKREAQIVTWNGDDLEQTTLIELARKRAGDILAADD
jgi:glyoxylase-like metal-dependent hydrolase (beta-lactamase superfamily II)